MRVHVLTYCVLPASNAVNSGGSGTGTSCHRDGRGHSLAGPGPGDGRADAARHCPMQQPRSGQTGQRLRICLISTRSPQLIHRVTVRRRRGRRKTAKSGGLDDTY